MYIEHPYFYEGKYYANIDGEMIEITKKVAYAMNNFYRSSKVKKVEIKNEEGRVVDKMLREVPYSGQSIDGEGFMIEDFPDLNCDVEHSVLTKMEQQDIHKVIDQLNAEERMIIYGIFFENKTQTQMAEMSDILERDSLTTDILKKLSYQSKLGINLKKNLHYFNKEKLIKELIEVNEWYDSAEGLKNRRKQDEKL